MKKLSFISLIICALFVLNMQAGATGLSKDLSTYEIATVEDLHLGKNVEKIWTLTYNPSETPVTVTKRTTHNATYYIVRAEFFEVAYKAGNEGFGVQLLKKNWSTVHPAISKAVFNQEQLKQQTILTSNKIEDSYALGLIASYLPDLVNDTYKHLLN